MDPDEALAKLREALQLYYRRYRDKGTGLEEADQMADGIEALDDWLSRGGFLPEDWSKNRKETK